MIRTTRFDAAEFLDDEALMATYLDEALAEGAKPRLDTIARLTQALGLRLTVTPEEHHPSSGT